VDIYYEIVADTLQAMKCLHGSNKVFRSWSVKIMHCIPYCRLVIWFISVLLRVFGRCFLKVLEYFV